MSTFKLQEPVTETDTEPVTETGTETESTKNKYSYNDLLTLYEKEKELNQLLTQQNEDLEKLTDEYSRICDDYKAQYDKTNTTLEKYGFDTVLELAMHIKK